MEKETCTFALGVNLGSEPINGPSRRRHSNWARRLCVLRESLTPKTDSTPPLPGVAPTYEGCGESWHPQLQVSGPSLLLCQLPKQEVRGTGCKYDSRWWIMPKALLWNPNFMRSRGWPAYIHIETKGGTRHSKKSLMQQAGESEGWLGLLHNMMTWALYHKATPVKVRSKPCYRDPPASNSLSGRQKAHKVTYWLWSPMLSSGTRVPGSETSLQRFQLLFVGHIWAKNDHYVPEGMGNCLYTMNPNQA